MGKLLGPQCLAGATREGDVEVGRSGLIPVAGLGLCVVILGMFFPRKTGQYTLTRTGTVTHIGESFDAGFIEIEVDSIVFDDPQTASTVGTAVPLPAHLRVGETVLATGQWTATLPWWRSTPPRPPVVTLVQIRRVIR